MRINEYITSKIELFRFLEKKAGFKPENIFFTGTIGGLSSTMILVAVATAVYNLYAGKANMQLFLIFLLLLALMVTAQRILYHKWVGRLESSVEQTRNELCEKLISSELKTIENLNRGEVYNRLTQELTNISQFGVYIIKAVQAIFIVVFTSLYILNIFAPALIVIGGLIITASFIYLAMIKKIYSRYDEINRTEIDYFNWLSDVLYGRKEIKLNSERRQHILTSGKLISDELKNGKLKIGSLYNKSMVFTTAFFYLLFGSVVFLLPLLFDINSGTLLVLTAVTIYLTDPISNIVSVVPLFQKVALSINYVSKLENVLEKASEEEDTSGDQTKEFKKIEIKDVKYRYIDGENEFVLGPVNAEINKGEIIFFTGGNGCGKTTLIKIIASLYKPEEGEILLDGISILRRRNGYRKMFGCVFSDFHLFEKVYGLNEESYTVINERLKKFNLQDKVTLSGNSFSTLDLSTGQKKRLALVISLAEDKDIYVFDEWAAEQDPEYRDYFYNDLLNELKDKGKTVIAVSHDERYFKVADKIIQMDYGKIKSSVTQE